MILQNTLNFTVMDILTRRKIAAFPTKEHMVDNDQSLGLNI